MLFACQTKTAEQETTTATTPETPIQWLTFEGKADMPKIVLVSGDEEYRSEETLPQLAKILSEHHGFNCTVLFAQDPEAPGIINPNYLYNIPGLEQLSDADMMVMFTRFRALPDEQMAHIEAYLKSGKPVLGIRTATHAFFYNDKVPFESSYTHYGDFNKLENEWADGFGRLVLGEHWVTHHGHHKHQSTRGLQATGTADHPIWQGIEDGAIWGATDVYGVRLPLPGDAQAIVLGQVVNRAGEFDEDDLLYGMRDTDTEVATTTQDKEYHPNDPMMPIAWTKSYQLPGGQTGKAFTTTIGASTDFLNEGVRRMMVNASYWLLDKAVPSPAKVDLVGDYAPTPFAFLEEDHFVKKNVSVASLAN